VPLPMPLHRVAPLYEVHLLSVHSPTSFCLERLPLKSNHAKRLTVCCWTSQGQALNATAHQMHHTAHKNPALQLLGDVPPLPADATPPPTPSAVGNYQTELRVAATTPSDGSASTANRRACSPRPHCDHLPIASSIPHAITNLFFTLPGPVRAALAAAFLSCPLPRHLPTVLGCAQPMHLRPPPEAAMLTVTLPRLSGSASGRAILLQLGGNAASGATSDSAIKDASDCATKRTTNMNVIVATNAIANCANECVAPASGRSANVIGTPCLTDSAPDPEARTVADAFSSSTDTATSGGDEAPPASDVRVRLDSPTLRSKDKLSIDTPMRWVRFGRPVNRYGSPGGTEGHQEVRPTGLHSSCWAAFFLRASSRSMAVPAEKGDAKHSMLQQRASHFPRFLVMLRGSAKLHVLAAV
jgi:hypothetical protein